MNREIKFRGKRTGFTNWLYFYMTHDLSDDSGVPPDFLQYQLDIKTIGQFTGLPDKKDKEIYEGDILSNEFNALGVVKFINGMFLVDFVYKESTCSKDNDKSTVRLISVNRITSIVGNIHENPELLNK